MALDGAADLQKRGRADCGRVPVASVRAWWPGKWLGTVKFKNWGVSLPTDSGDLKQENIFLSTRGQSLGAELVAVAEQQPTVRPGRVDLHPLPALLLAQRAFPVRQADVRHLG